MKTRKRKMVKGSERLLREIESRLRNRYGAPRHFNPIDPLDDLIFLVLSRMTQELKYRRTYEALRIAMPTWEMVRDAPSSEIEELIHDAGLAKTKTSQIQEILREVSRREMRLDLAHLKKWSDDEIEEYLTSLPGVGRKIARCVMLYALDRNTCPVDTHVLRVMTRLGFSEGCSWTERRARDIEAQIPQDIRASFHVTLLSLGREVCRAKLTLCGECPIGPLCPTGSSISHTSE